MARASIGRSLAGERMRRAAATVLARLARLPTLWATRARNRRELSRLTAEQMRDTGLDPDLVRRESRKPFWRA